MQQLLASLREGLYAGRGPGIGEAELRRNTSLRPEIAGVPTARRREELHLRTLARRGEVDEAVEEGVWAAAQFPTR